MPGPPKPLPPPVPPPRAPSAKTNVKPIPTSDGFMSTQAKMSLAEVAQKLRDEQLEAKVVLYRADLETSAELDAVTAQVVRELHALQAAAGHGRAAAPAAPFAAEDRAQVEIELIQSLKEMLSRIFKKGRLATLLERKLAEVAKRFARVFFESELHDKIRGSTNEAKQMRFAEQALYHVLVRNQEHLVRELESFDYKSPEVLERATELFQDNIKELRNDFLSRTTPELNQLVNFLNGVLTAFFTEELPPMLGELSWEVVKEAKLADAKMTAGYKISASTFPRFRQAFERRFLQRLVPFVEDEMLRKVREGEQQFRDETIRLVADPYIFSELCEIVCDAIYDMLYNDGFLDLPGDWRVRLASATTQAR